MKKTISVLLIFALFISIMSLFTGCSHSLSGSWRVKDKDDLSDNAYRYLPVHFELFDDGNGTCKISYYSGTQSITWSSSGSRLMINARLVYDFTYDYSFDGSDLVLQYRDYTVTYERN